MAKKGNTKDAGGQEGLAQKVGSHIEASTSTVLSGAEKYIDGQTHIGVAVLVTSSGQPSTLMIPDITKVSEGAPVFITKPIRIEGSKLKDFLSKKGVQLDKENENKVAKLIADTTISCEAFYYSNGPMLMVFAIKFEEGLISSLTGDEALGDLFEIQGASLRVLRCDSNSFDVLKQYAAGLES